MTYKAIIITAFVMMVTNVFGQYTNQVNETAFKHENTFNYLLNYQDTLVSITTVNDSNATINNWNYLSFKKYDENFNVIIEKTYTDSTFLYSGFYGLEYLKGAYYYCGTKRKTGEDTLKGFIVKFDTLGNFIWEKTYYTDNESVKIGFMESNSTNLFFLSNIYNPTSGGSKYTILSEIDTSGNLIWDKNFIGQLENGNSVNLTSDGGLIISLASQTNPFGNNKPNIYKLDSNGNIQWPKSLGPSEKSHYLSVAEMPNGNFLGYGHSVSPFWDSTYNKSRAWLVELDKNNGNVLKDTVFMLSPVHSIFGSYSDVIFKDDHFLLVASTNYDQANPAYKPNLVSINYDFSINWRYQYESQIGRDTESMFELLDLQNGFYLMAGITYQNTPSNTNDEWFLVVDSLGCDDQFCTVGINPMSQFENDGNLKIFPNPAQNEIYIEIKNKPYQNYSYQILDISGKIVSSGTTLANQSINISSFPNGYYLIRVINEDNYISKPLIINR